MNKATLHNYLRRLARRLFVVNAATGAGWGLFAALAILLTTAWIDLIWELSPAVRISGWVVGGIVGIAALATWIVLAVRSGTPTALARRLDRAGGASGQISTGVDLLIDNRTAPPLTAGLSAMAVDRATKLASEVVGARAVPARKAAKAFGGFAMLAAATVLVALLLPRLAQSQWLRFLDPYGDHPPYSRVQFVVEPGDVRVVFGKGFDVRVHTEGGVVERLDLVLTPDNGTQEVLPMFPESDGGWRATVASVVSPGRYLVRSRDGRSRNYRLDVQTVPKIESVRFRIAPPEYTHLPAYEGPLPKGGIAGLPGTRVDFVVHSNRPLAGGHVEFPGSKSSRHAPRDDSHAEREDYNQASLVASDSEARGHFVVTKSGPMTISVVDIDNQKSDDQFTAPVALLVDEKPFVRLLEPQPISFASPTAVLPIAIAAEDDYGISRLQLFRSLNESRGMPLDVPVPRPEPTRRIETIPLPLFEYDLQPGDEIKLFARVEDNDPAGAKGDESAVAIVRIISQAEIDRMMRVQRGMEMLRSKYQSAQRAMENLAEEVDRLSKSADDPEKQKEVQDELKKLADKMEAQAEALKKLAEQKLEYDLDQALSHHVERLSREVQSAAEQARSLAGQSMSAAELKSALDRLKNQLERERQQAMQKTVKPLESLALVVPLAEDAARFRSLVERQRSLADRSKSLDGKEQPSDPASKARLREYDEEQQRIRADLSKLLDSIEDHAAQLPDEPEFEELKSSALEFAAKVRDSGADEAMAAAEDGFRESSGTRGHAGAKKAAEILESLMEKCDGMGGQCESCLRFKVGLGEGLGDSIGQLLADAGFGGASGSGSGGSSARRDGLRNVGLYGDPNSAGANPTSGLMSEPRTSATGFARPVGSGVPGHAAPGAKAGMANSAAEALIPLPYRKRVAEYFQRIADDTGDK